ncbi:1-aminocyclopropane-1-carboxylate synthase 7-like [Dorcoceras hygrometricum]|uniref:1-aminocyclopropane-1-carboxylate synthase 7-like n=1 Tax=Dorcoceras hygrometricum TaxID=472368 RepID=A0A2Z7AKG9_9LAMI|nr:1-aminocyclopropane-1-carboxylate synthase 7-like [Dorcoceras hygrometricum]
MFCKVLTGSCPLFQTSTIATGYNSSLQLLFLRLNMQGTVGCDWVHCSSRLVEQLATGILRLVNFFLYDVALSLASGSSIDWFYCSFLLIADVTADVIIA